jgi:hypothetical protein
VRTILHNVAISTVLPAGHLQIADRAVLHLGGLLLLFLAGCAGDKDWSPTVQDSPAELAAHFAPGEESVGRGFRGDRHPLLAAGTTLEVEAFWTPLGYGAIEADLFPLRGGGNGREFGTHRSSFPLESHESFRQLSVAQRRRKYSARHFSAFMPSGDRLTTVGETWALDLAGVSRFLTQFHPAVSMHLDSTGRLPGPNGAYAILRAVSPTHAEIAFRIHAEIEPEPGVFFTPAHFSGTLVINKQTGEVEAFQLAMPMKDALNAMLTVVLENEALIDLIRVHRMELVGSSASSQRIEWESAIGLPEAKERLTQLFFDFMAIDWVPPEQAVAFAQETKKPILAVVLWGALDDQSC